MDEKSRLDAILSSALDSFVTEDPFADEEQEGKEGGIGHRQRQGDTAAAAAFGAWQSGSGRLDPSLDNVAAMLGPRRGGEGAQGQSPSRGGRGGGAQAEQAVPETRTALPRVHEPQQEEEEEGDKVLQDEEEEDEGAVGRREAFSADTGPEDMPEDYRQALDALLARMAAEEAGEEDHDGGEHPEGSDRMQASLQETLEMIAKTAHDLEGVERAHSENMSDEEMVAKLMEDMGKLENDPNFRGMMDGMVGQLLSKDVLYPGLKDLQGRFPSWLEQNSNSIPPEDRERYVQQLALLNSLIDEYEKSDPNMESIMSLFEEMHSHGAPPDELVKEVVPGADFGEDGIPVFPGAPGGPSAADGEGQNCSIM